MDTVAVFRSRLAGEAHSEYIQAKETFLLARSIGLAEALESRPWTKAEAHEFYELARQSNDPAFFRKVVAACEQRELSAFQTHVSAARAGSSLSLAQYDEDAASHRPGILLRRMQDALRRFLRRTS